MLAADPGEAHGQDAEDSLVQRMKRILQPFVLRRVKADVLQQLPAKKHQVAPAAVPLSNCKQKQDDVSDTRTVHTISSS